MSKRISLNAFDMTTPTHQSPGLWRHPDNRADTYNTLEYWTELAQILEQRKEQLATEMTEEMGKVIDEAIAAAHRGTRQRAHHGRRRVDRPDRPR